MEATPSSTWWGGLRSRALALLALLAAGCSMFPESVPITPQTGEPVPIARIYRPRLTQPSPGHTAKVLFLKDAGGPGTACSNDVLVDDDKVFTIRAGEFQALYLAPGEHKFVVQVSPGLCQAFSRADFTILRDGVEETHRIFSTPFRDGFDVQQLISTSGSSAFNNSFRTAHYEWIAPSEGGWTLGVWEEPFVLTDAISPTTEFRIVVLENPINGERLKGRSAEFVADDYRRREEEDMIENGVETGQYALSDVERGEVTAGGNTFWTMRYQQHHQLVTSRATLFLYFPQPSDNEHFLVILYIATAPQDVVPGSGHEGELMHLLESVRARP